ncbi:hypothetical protein L2E82_38589 [Cichorium intybus]|uniref:Uncharacterized protein n=1 Tax=Cichorium intybus TaxID=13427 RepID=A0ACB9AFP1_CICIN|nr:hypothetical protein L2E82_38589 [Cichorium intybus]
MTDTTSLLSDGDDDSSDSSWIFTDNASSSNSDISQSDSICSISSIDIRSYKDVVANGGTRPPSGPGTSYEQAQTRDMLKAVDSKGKNPLHEQDNWEIVAKKESRKEKLDYPSKQHYLPDDCYQKYRITASQHWDAANAFYAKARIAHASGKCEDAKYFSNQGRMSEEKARQADETASKDIFDSREDGKLKPQVATNETKNHNRSRYHGRNLKTESPNPINILNSRNKGFENSITIDLHGQHVKEGVQILKHHLEFAVYRRSLQQLRVITGYGSHGTGASELKKSLSCRMLVVGC